MPTPDTAPVARFFDAVTRRDFAACIKCLAEDVTFKALLPDAQHDVTGSREAAWLLTHWFDDALEVEVLDQVVDTIVDHVRIRYRLRLKYENGWHIWEQQGYCTTAAGRIADMELVGCGFLRERD
jgi:ketosteroid isomerase-like protein